jgi:uncharacterized protein DUF4406
MTTYYVCGPISGYEDGNRDAFRAAARQVEERGDVAIIPHDLAAMGHDGPCPPSHAAVTTGDHAAACYLRADLLHMLMYCDALYVLRGWEASVGARLEVMVATTCGLPLEFQT